MLERESAKRSLEWEVGGRGGHAEKKAIANHYSAVAKKSAEISMKLLKDKQNVRKTSLTTSISYLLDGLLCF